MAQLARLHTDPPFARRPGRAAALAFLIAVTGLLPGGDGVLAQEDELNPLDEDELTPLDPNGTASLNYVYTENTSGCVPVTGECSQNIVNQQFTGSVELSPVEGGFEGKGQGRYEYTIETTVTAPGCAQGMYSRMAVSGQPSLTVNAQCSIDNPITGGPDTSMYGRDTTVVEEIVESNELFMEVERRDCEGNTEAWNSQEGSAYIGCFFYGADFKTGGSYTSENQVTDTTTGKCTLNLQVPWDEDLRIFGTVTGLRDGMPPVPIANAKLVMMDLPDERLERLSVSKPEFRKITHTSDDENAEYEFTRTLCYELPKVMVVSLLWYGDKPEFAVTNGPEPAPEERGIPVYLAACVDDVPGSKCFKWQPTGTGGYEAEVNFTYGDDDLVQRQQSFLDTEERIHLTNREAMMKETAYVYYNTWRGVKYFNQLALGYPRNAVDIRTHYSHGYCVSDVDDPRPDNAWYSEDGTTFGEPPFKFGDLGTYLGEVTATGGTIFMCPRSSAVGYPDAPVNREWHELGHYLQQQMYHPTSTLKPCPNCKDHGGYPNDNTSWSLIEGYAEFVGMTTNQFYGSASPHVYPVGTAALNLELDYKPWGAPGNEELAVAGVLWDLHDPGREIGLQHRRDGQMLDISRVYPAAVDSVSMPEKDILAAIGNDAPQTVVDLWNTAFSTLGVGEDELSMIFLDHGFFADIEQRNYIHDSAGERIGESGETPDRPLRERPLPPLPGSWITAEGGGSFEVVITMDQAGGDGYDYSYPLEIAAGEPAYFTMPPEYYPSRAAIYRVINGQRSATPVLEISSDDYWRHVNSGPEKSAVFRRIPAGKGG